MDSGLLFVYQTRLRWARDALSFVVTTPLWKCVLAWKLVHGRNSRIHLGKRRYANVKLLPIKRCRDWTSFPFSFSPPKPQTFGVRRRRSRLDVKEIQPEQLSSGEMLKLPRTKIHTHCFSCTPLGLGDVWTCASCFRVKREWKYAHGQPSA